MSLLSDIASGGTAPIVESVVGLGRDLIDRIFPDKTAQAKERAEATQHLLDVTAAHETQLLAATAASDAQQSAINLAEAQSTSFFKGGWRPLIGWVCGIALALNYWPRAIVLCVLWCHHVYVSGVMQPYPDLGTTDLVGLLGSILGLAVVRSTEVHKGVADGHANGTLPGAIRGA